MIYKSPHISARLVEAGSERVVVSFPDRVHPLGPDVPGWGEAFLMKRGISAVYISLEETNWFQIPDFLEAMRACRAHLGARTVTCYGSSMGGYAAILAAKSLEANLCVALSPQFSIDPKVVPFERRYKDYARQIGPFVHDITQEVSPTCQYVVASDPTHGQDKRHLARIEESYSVARLPAYCCGHGVLRDLKSPAARDSLADLLAGRGRLGGVRHHLRDQRRENLRYLKKIRRLARERGHERLFDYDEALRGLGRGHLAEAAQKPAVNPHRRPKIVVHCGLPKTGTSSLQGYCFTHADRYREAGIFYPTAGADKRDLNHAWFSQQLRDASVAQLQETLSQCPASCDRMLLSDESLFVDLPGLSGLARGRLAEALSGYEVELVLFEREKTAWMRSFYLQSVQNRRAGRITERPSARNLWQTPKDYEAFFQQPYCQRLLDFDAMRRDLAEVFGVSEVKVLRFERGKDVVETFCDAMGWPHLGEGPKLALNPSITDTQAEILRQANGMSGERGRMIKSLIEIGDGGFSGLRRKRLERLANTAKDFPWERLRYQENPPLKITPEGFYEALDVLRQRAKRIVALVEGQ